MQTHQKQMWLLTAFGSVVIFLIASLPVLNQNFPELERQIFMILYDIPSFLIQPMQWLTQFGGVSAAVGAVGALWLVGKRRLSLELAVNSTLAFFLAWGMKSLIARPRPLSYMTDLVQHEWGTAGNGFPSGHAALVTVLAVTLWPYVEPKYRPILVLLVTGVCLSRISLGVHAPLDVIGGVCVGLFVVSITKLLVLYIPQLKSIAKLR